MMFLFMFLFVISCDSNTSNTSEIQGSPQRKSTVIGVGGSPPSANPESSKCTGQTSTVACGHKAALDKQMCLPQGKEFLDCNKSITLTSTSSSVYDYLNLATAAYKNAYYKNNIDIIAFSQNILKSESSEEICRLSFESLKALDSVEKNFIDPYGYLKDVYDLFRKASETSKTESCSAGPLKTGLK